MFTRAHWVLYLRSLFFSFVAELKPSFWHPQFLFSFKSNDVVRLKMSVVPNLAAQWSQNGPPVLNPNIPEVATNKSLRDVCREKYAEETVILESNFTEPFCKVSFDRVSCWPPTPAGTTAVIKCMAYLNNIRYDDTRKFSICYVF